MKRRMCSNAVPMGSMAWPATIHPPSATSSTASSAEMLKSTISEMYRSSSSTSSPMATATNARRASAARTGRAMARRSWSSLAACESPSERRAFHALRASAPTHAGAESPATRRPAESVMMSVRPGIHAEAMAAAAPRLLATSASFLASPVSDASSSSSKRRVIAANMPTPSSTRMPKNVAAYHAVRRRLSRTRRAGSAAGRPPAELTRSGDNPRRAGSG